MNKAVVVVVVVVVVVEGLNFLFINLIGNVSVENL